MNYKKQVFPAYDISVIWLRNALDDLTLRTYNDIRGSVCSRLSNFGTAAPINWTQGLKVAFVL